MKFSLQTIKNSKKLTGITLIETLVAISILLISIVGPMEIASKGLFSAFYARDEITAYYLAQEGLEYVRYARDTTTMVNDIYETSYNWLDGLEDCFLDGDGATVDECMINPTESFYIDDGAEPYLNEDAVLRCSDEGTNGQCSPIGFDVDTGVYSYDDSYVDSKFTRKILITEVTVDQETLIESTVTWQTGSLFSSTKSFTLRERLFNWQRK